MENTIQEVTQSMEMGIYEPTCNLRINICKNHRIEQLWVNKLTDNKKWKELPIFRGDKQTNS